MKRIIFVLLALLSACNVVPPPAATSDIDAYYKLAKKPPAGYERIYVLTPITNSVLGNPHEVDGRVYVGTENQDMAQAGVLNKSRFVAFDVKKRSLLIQFRPLYASSYTMPSQSFDISPGKIMVIRPIVNASGGAFGLIGLGIAAAINEGSPEYEYLGISDALPMIHTKQLSGISAEAKAYVQQEVVKK